MQQTISPTPQQRRMRIDRAHEDEIQKIELRIQDVADVSIDTRILNKLQRKMQRQK